MTLSVALANVANTLVVSPGPASNKIFVDANGQVGFGASPSGWGNTAKGVDITGNTYAFLNFNSTSSSNLTNNAYWDGTNWRYKTTGYTNAIGLTTAGSGGLQLYTAASGTAGNTVNFIVGMSIDPSGRVTKPNQPAFHVTAGAATTSGNTVTYTATVFDIGSNVNLGNGRFTAPVAGIYYVQYHQLAPNANLGEYRMAIYKNGVTYGGLRWIAYKDTASTWQYLFAQGHVQCAAGDYITAVYELGPAALYTDANYGAFTGDLVG